MIALINFKDCHKFWRLLNAEVHNKSRLVPLHLLLAGSKLSKERGEVENGGKEGRKCFI